jgi:hypothetical protein
MAQDASQIRPKARCGGSKAQRRARYFAEQRRVNGAAPEPDPVATARRYEAAFALRNQPANQDPQQPVWRNIGPFSIPHGQMTLDSAAKLSVSGRVSSIAIHPGDPERILLGSAEGGIWESADRGQTWKPVTDDQSCLAIGALVFDPKDGRFAYAGTGEGNNFGDEFAIGDGHKSGRGLLRRNEAGEWHMIAAETFTGQAFFDLKVDPKDPSRLFAATTAGLFEGSAYGDQWRPCGFRIGPGASPFIRRRTKSWPPHSAESSVSPAMSGSR